MNTQDERWESYMAEVNTYWAKEAANAYAERKAQVWAEFSRAGIKPWMQYQVAPRDLPFKIAQ